MALKYDDLLNTQYNYSGLGKTFAKDLSNVFLANEMEEVLKKRKEEQQQEEEKEQKESFSGSGEIGLASMIAPLEMPSSQSELIEIPTDVPGETEIVRVNGLSSLNPQNVQEQAIEQERQPQAGLNLLSPSVLEESEEMEDIEEPMVSFEEMANSLKNREKIQKYFNIPLDVDLLQSSLMYDAFQGKQPGTTAQEMVREYNDILREKNALIQAEDNREYQRMKDAYQAKRQEYLDKENIKKSKLEREDKLREALIKAQKPTEIEQKVKLLEERGATNEQIINYLLNERKGYQAISIEDKIKLEDVKQKNKLELQKLESKNKIQEQNTKQPTVNTEEEIKEIEEFKKVANRFEKDAEKNDYIGIGVYHGKPLIKAGLNLLSPKGIGTNEANLDAVNKKMVELTRKKLAQMGVKSGEINSATEQALYLYKLNPQMSVEQIKQTIKNFIDDYSSGKLGKKNPQQQVSKYKVKSIKTKGE